MPQIQLETFGWYAAFLQSIFYSGLYVTGISKPTRRAVALILSWAVRSNVGLYLSSNRYGRCLISTTEDTTGDIIRQPCVRVETL